jgi:peptidoglycan/LPS O-acetylase OafA/YrhL
VSVSLDVIRVSLALVVVATHLTLPVFQSGWPKLVMLGVAAVGGFFVLSGFTISLLTDHSRAFDPRRYASDRLSRLWSVALPALALTVVCDLISSHVNPGFYDANIGDSADHPAARILVNALFLSQVWGQDYSPLSNNPFWSLGYEFGFYAIYGAWLAFPRRWRALACLAIIAAFGPNVALLMLMWLVGVGIHVAYVRFSPKQALVASIAAVVVLAVVGAAALVLRDSAGTVVTLVQRGLRAYFGFFGVSSARVESKIIFSGLAFGGFFFCVICAAKANDAYRFVSMDRFVNGARRIGEFTFPLYLFHFPLYILAAASGVYVRTSTPQKAALFCVVCCVIFVLTPVTEIAKLQIRARMNALLGLAPPRAREVAASAAKVASEGGD